MGFIAGGHAGRLSRSVLVEIPVGPCRSIWKLSGLTGSHNGTGLHPSHCILELQEQLRSRTLVVTIVRRIRVDENFPVDILLFREFHGDDMSRRR